MEQEKLVQAEGLKFRIRLGEKKIKERQGVIDRTIVEGRRAELCGGRDEALGRLESLYDLYQATAGHPIFCPPETKCDECPMKREGNCLGWT